MYELLGTQPGVFIGLTLILFGSLSYLSGQALANNWLPVWQTLPYGFLMGFADRFLTYALFEGVLLHPFGYIVHSLVLIGIMLFAYRVTQVRKMINQYPWIYERAGLLRWREKRA